MDKPRLDQGLDYERGFIDGMMYQTQSSVDKAVNAMTQPEQEPVAWMNDSTPSGIFARHMEGAKNFGCTIPLYTAPPQRPWVGLTDEEIKEVLDCGRGGLVDIKKAEQMLKEKNK